ncbi:MAG: hypothetical protein RL153_2481 [Verrucomicrobiota bacterium]
MRQPPAFGDPKDASGIHRAAPLCARHPLDDLPNSIRRAPRTHPVGMQECSRWLSEATPPEPITPLMTRTPAGVPERGGNGLAKTPRREPKP